MSTRSRRANAGNRLSQLLAEQTPLNDEEAELFAEREDDEDFDIEAEEERQRQLAAAAALSSDGDENERGGDGDDGDGDGDGDDDDDDDDDDDSEHDDSNFSDSTDDSDIENDAEPADAGEKELEKEQRVRSREKRTAERNKLFTIKRREPQPERASTERKKKRVFTSADLLQNGRHSSRKSALRNKQHLIEQMREVEERRARYVPPKKKHQPKLTQEQRLEEAKKTEAKNLASLNKFVELEEERKLQQRLAMISKRPKLTQFIRFHSAQYLDPPKLIEIVEKTEDDEGAVVKQEPPPNNLQAQTEQPDPHNPPAVAQVPTGPSAGASLDEPKAVLAQDSDDSATKPEIKSEVPEQSSIGNDSGPVDNAASVTNSPDERPQEKAQEPKPESAAGTTGSKEEAEVYGASQAVGNAESPAVVSPDPKENETVSVKREPREAHEPVEVKEEPDAKFNPDDDDDERKLDLAFAEPVNPVQGPSYLRTYDFLTLHDFPDASMNKYAMRSIVLGRIASMPAHMPLKRMCPFSGVPARYLDPATGVAYYDLETNKMLKMAAENKLGWSRELGGVFLGTTGEQRHAKGVPEGFA